ncbi:hypothetical protein BT67DRAFT_379092 [Trichocladium antarcticum]|uniref:Secreted protein n=1 Tax=Trichocladium antarcticum TaxID=1450529 RepID=A0AAN6ULQ3_9PEZI|nr:hypothetical protein BT67DRAFT_379092 [Trichocladium antarcticum]
MPHQNLLAIASAVLAAVTRGEAKILSCADVDCPIASGSTSANCTVVDKAFNAVGVATLDTDIEGFNDLSWLKAVGAQDVGEKRRVFDQSFYLGTPDDFDFGGAGACALFFSEVSDRVRFGDDDARRTTGTCAQALTDSCVSALVDRAKAVDLDGLSSTAACQKLGRDLSDNLDTECSSFATGKKWTGIKAQALSGKGSPEPISDKQNATSNCWPILPKHNNLRLVESINITVQAHLTCLKTIDMTTASNATRTPNDGGGENGAGGRRLGVGALWVGALSMVFVVLLG